MHKAPRILGGNITISRELFERAIALAPSNTVTLMYAAELAIQTGDRDRAAAFLQRVLESSVDPEWEFESNRDRARARSLLEQLSSS